jgi:phospholipid/cholesterol/gamma-HCH transport system permease protein
MTTTEVRGGTADSDAFGRTVAGVRRSFEGKIKNLVDMVRFSGQTLVALPRAMKYPSEVFRQTGIVILSSGFVVVGMQFVVGFTLGYQAHYLLKPIGANGLVGLLAALDGPRFAMPALAGWILAAKVGCGLVAEIGSARISDEIDALEVMGIDSRVYMVGTRIVAILLALPFLLIIGLLMFYLGAYVNLVPLLKSVSPGGFVDVLWGFQNSYDVICSLIWAIGCGLTVILVGCYYGYHAQGGPVGVGQNTAKSMVVNMVLVSAVGLACLQLFWGGNTNAPIGN